MLIFATPNGRILTSTLPRGGPVAAMGEKWPESGRLPGDGTSLALSLPGIYAIPKSRYTLSFPTIRRRLGFWS